MTAVALPVTTSYTIDDWREWREVNPETHIELSEGNLILMTPPKVNHNRVVSHLMAWLISYGYDADIVLASCGLVAGHNGRIPDLMVLCDEIDGNSRDVDAGDVRLVVEVESESTRAADRYIKPDEYAAAGVGHYWRVTEGAPNEAWVNCYVLRGDEYELYLRAPLTQLVMTEPVFHF